MTRPGLVISPDLSLPLDVVTSTLIVYGGKGMGKTNFGSVVVEEFTKAGLRWCFLDPMGVAWGLRHSLDGKGPGIECVILGGVHGDIPIEPTAGAIVADLVIDEGVNTIIDFSRRPDGKMWSVGERVRFVTEYTVRLFERQGGLIEGRRREPFMQILDEAARYIPQVIPSGAMDLAKCVGAWEQVCEEGRNIGLGVTFLTQRSARMNKSVSELADVMIAFRTVGPRSLDAVMDWLGEHVEKARIHGLAAQVRELNIGQALVVSPGWLRVEKIVQIRPRETFDSSATPKPGQQAKRVTGKAAKPDLARYHERMAATIEKVKADDPTTLRKRIAELQAAAKTHRVVGPDEIEAVRTFEYAAGRERERSEIRKAMRGVVVGLASIAVDIENLNLSKRTHAIAESVEAATSTVAAGPRVVVPRSEVQRSHVPPRAPAPASTNGNGALAAGEKIVLIAIASYDDGVDRDQLSVLTGYKRSTRDAYISRAAARGQVEVSGSRVVITQAGIDALGDDYEPLPTGEALQAHWMRRLPEGESRVLNVLVERYPDGVGRPAIDEATGFKRSTRDAYLSRLKSRRLVTFVGGDVRASETLFS